MKTLLLFLITTLWVSSIIIIIIPAVHSQCIKHQQLSLLQFKKGLVFNVDESTNTKLVSWNASTDCCTWEGVTCSRSGRVLGLNINGQDISSGIFDDSSSLFHLHYLQSLNVADNELFQSIPSAIGKLLNLRYLNLSNNGYVGDIPMEISRLRRLVVVDISNNRIMPLTLSGNLHLLVQNFIELRELYLDGVEILEQGTEWCQAISSSLPNLKVLSMPYCGLSGPLHESLAKLHSLSVINLEGNSISAPVPGFFANLTNLTVLRLASCGLQGIFPKEIFQLPSLQVIDLSSCDQLGGSLPEFPSNGSLRYLNLSDTKFSGLLPNSIGNLKMLSDISIANCNFTGQIPKSMADLTQLVNIDLSHNGLTGTITSTHWRNLTKLSKLRLNSNKLDGNIPSSLFSFPHLSLLDLHGNQLSGKLPENSNVSSVPLNGLDLQIDLSYNNLQGQIPMFIFSLLRLTVLDLSSNNFSGSFPFDGLYQLIFSLLRLTVLDLSSNNFSGSFPFDGLYQLINLNFLDLSHNNLSSSHDHTNFSYSSLSQLQHVRLASMKLRSFPNFLRNQSNLVDLDLSDNQINEKIPGWTQSLGKLAYLNLSCNYLDSLEVPSINLTNLDTLDLHSNQIYGQIPIFQPTNSPTYLDLSRNYFSSHIPNTFGNFGTVFLSLSTNNVSGTIPESLCNSQSLVVLDMSNNSLSGTIPQCLTQMSTLEVLNLRRNNLTSVDEFSDWCSLKTLDISANQIPGKFLKSLVNCNQLEVLNLGSNRIAEPFPCFLRNISTLRVLVLRSNKFYGRIGCQKTNGTYWPVLQIIDLARNNFSGELPGEALTTLQAMRTSNHTSSQINNLRYKYRKMDPEFKIWIGPEMELVNVVTIVVTNKGQEMELVNVLTIFTSIDFSCNKFNGSIPKEIGELKSLYALNLSNNAFTGAIPTSLSNLSQLESLDLSKNILSSQIPPELTNLTFLAFLNLSYNQLVGRIPSGAQFSTFDAASFQGNKGLWGPPLTSDDRTRFLPKPEGNQPNPWHEIDWDIICPEIGFACGFGIAIGSLMFCKRWRKWYYRAMYNMLLKIFPQLEQRFGRHRRHVYVHQRFWRR